MAKNIVTEYMKDRYDSGSFKRHREHTLPVLLFMSAAAEKHSFQKRGAACVSYDRIPNAAGPGGY